MSDGRAVILLADSDRDRWQSIARFADGEGARVVPADAASVASAGLTDSIGLGLVYLGADTVTPAGLASVRALALRGVSIIAYGDGLDRWPIGVRCTALLAGATTLLDSARPKFFQDLWNRITDLWAAEAGLAREQEDVRRTFERLGVVGDSDAMRRLFRRTVSISRLSDLHTLITGETGTGKQLFAQAIHQLDPKRQHGPFVAVNCAAISPHLAESELFGHRRGAFTGADRERKGLFRSAHGGVLLLDEIGEMDLALQAKVLRVLQEGRVLSVGDDEEAVVDVRVIAATNRDLEGMVANHTFRADLFHRLNVVSLHIPPLRERRSDIDALVRHFVARQGHPGGRRPLRAEPDFVAALEKAELPGNIRELENLIRRAVVSNEHQTTLGLADLPREVWSRVSELEQADGPAGTGDRDVRPPGVDPAAGSAYLWQMLSENGWSLTRSLEVCERALVEGALRTANGNQSHAARLLGLTPRSVYNKLRKYQLPRRSA